MTPEQRLSARLLHDVALAHIALSLRVPMDEVRVALTEPTPEFQSVAPELPVDQMLDALDGEAEHHYERFVASVEEFLDPEPAPAEPEVFATGEGWTSEELPAAKEWLAPHEETPATEAGDQVARTPAEGTLAFEVMRVNAEHPDWTARQVADHLGKDQKHVDKVAKNWRIVLRKLTPEELAESRRNGGRKGSATLHARPEEPEAASEPHVEAEVLPTEKEPAAEPKFTPQHSDAPPKIVKPRGQQFRLRTGNGEGKYLHMSCFGLVPGRSYAWIGSASQLEAVRKKFPETIDLHVEIVEKEEVRK